LPSLAATTCHLTLQFALDNDAMRACHLMR
jgi:hypothetical protein